MSFSLKVIDAVSPVTDRFLSIHLPNDGVPYFPSHLTEFPTPAAHHRLQQLPAH